MCKMQLIDYNTIGCVIIVDPAIKKQLQVYTWISPFFQFSCRLLHMHAVPPYIEVQYVSIAKEVMQICHTVDIMFRV